MEIPRPPTGGALRRHGGAALEVLPGAEVPPASPPRLGIVRVAGAQQPTAVAADLLAGGVGQLHIPTARGVVTPSGSPTVQLGRILLRSLDDHLGRRVRELRWRLEPRAARQLAVRLERLGAHQRVPQLVRTVPAASGGEETRRETTERIVDLEATALSAVIAAAEIELWTSGPSAFKGLVRIRLRGNEQQQTAALAELTKRLGLVQHFSPVQRDSIITQLERWEYFRGQAQDLGRVSLERRSHPLVVPRSGRVGAGIRTRGALYAYYSLNSPGQVAWALRQGIQSTAERWLDGRATEGTSAAGTLEGPELSVVPTHVVFAHHEGTAWAGGRFKLLLTPEVFDRLDHVGWTGSGAELLFGSDLIDAMSRSPEERAAVLGFAHGVSNYSIAALCASNARDCRALEDALEQSGRSDLGVFEHPLVQLSGPR